MIRRPLVAVTQRVLAFAGREEVDDSLDWAWQSFLDACGCDAVPVPTRAVDPIAFFRRVGAEGLVLSGGNNVEEISPRGAWPERDRLERTLLDMAERESIPVVGVCRGMQMIAARNAWIARLAQAHAATRHGIAPCGRFRSRSRLFEREVNSYHDFALTPQGLPANLTPLARSNDGLVEAFIHAEWPQLGLMWHPEREPGFHEADVDLASALFRGNIRSMLGEAS